MNKEYKIMDISEGKDSRYGTILIVKANPIMNNSNSKSYTPYLYNKTETFFFPLKESFINNLVSIANEGHFWTPNKSDFKTEFVIDEDTNERKVVYRHMSFWNQNNGFTALNISPPVQISQKSYKVSVLYNQYIRNGWYESYSFSEYVVSLAENDITTNFWQWLFDTSKLNGYDPFDLPQKYYFEYKEFIRMCSEKEF